MKTIYKVYENKYFNNLLLNLISVKYQDNASIENAEYYITLKNAHNYIDNPCITFKTMLYICSLLTECGLNDNTFTITTTDVRNKLSISDITYFESAIKYLSSICYDYKVNSSWHSCNIISSYTRSKGYFKVVIDDDFLSLLDRTKQFYQVPKCLLNSDIRYNKHSIFIANYILLHKRRNKGKRNENVVSIKELIKNCPILPKYEELSKEQRQVSRSIIKPFEMNLNFACKLLDMTWQYVDEPNNYIDFTRAKIVLECRYS